MKNYIIVGDNNFWYATTEKVSEKKAIILMKEIKKGIKKDMFEDEYNGKPSSLYLYEAKSVAEINL
jgi:hypothetical protein